MGTLITLTRDMDKVTAESLEEECPTVEAWKWLKGQFV
jgi:hypothetical protein